MKKVILYIDFIRNIKSLMTEFLGTKSAKELSHWIWNEAGMGVENTPKALTSFQNFFRWNINIVITEAESIIPKKKYLVFLNNLANICRRHGEVYIASDFYEKVIRLAVNIPNTDKELGEAKLGQAIIFSDQAKFKDSSNLIRKADKHFNSVKNKAGQAECENILGIIDAEKGNLAAAQKHFKNALEFIKGGKTSLLKSKIVTNLGIVYNISGNYPEAVKYLKHASALFKELKLSTRYVEVKHNIGMLELKNERYRSALKEFLFCIKLAELEQYQPILGIANAGASEAYFRVGNMKLAELHIEKAIALSRKINDRLTIADIYRVRGLIEKNKKNSKLAESLFVTSIRINNELNNQLNATEAQVELGKMLLESNRNERAKAELTKAMRYYKKINYQNKVDEIKNLINQNIM